MSGFLNSPGLGDASSDAGGFDTSFLGGSFVGGSMVTAFVLGVGIIIAAKTVLSRSRSAAPRPTRKWAAGAWRSADYEDPRAPIFSDRELKKLLRKNRIDPAEQRRRGRASRFKRAF